MYISTFQSDSYLESLSEELPNRTKAAGMAGFYAGLIYEIPTTFNNSTIYFECISCSLTRRLAAIHAKVSLSKTPELYQLQDGVQ